MQVILPVEPGSQMATDLAAAEAMIATIRMARTAAVRRDRADVCDVYD